MRGITDGNLFAVSLTKDLRNVSRDLHLGVAYNPFKTPPSPQSSMAPRPRSRSASRRNSLATTARWGKAKCVIAMSATSASTRSWILTTAFLQWWLR
jgi:hypothetical protein